MERNTNSDNWLEIVWGEDAVLFPTSSSERHCRGPLALYNQPRSISASIDALLAAHLDTALILELYESVGKPLDCLRQSRRFHTL